MSVSGGVQLLQSFNRVMCQTQIQGCCFLLLQLVVVQSLVKNLQPSQLKTSLLAHDTNAWRRGYSTCPAEVAGSLLGSVPADLSGTFFRNGFAKFEVGSDLVLHPFDADGMVSAIQFDKGQAQFRNRFVRTKGFVEEQRTKKISFRGAFGTAKKGGFLANMFNIKTKNVANTNVVHWAGRLLALWEGGLPHLMEPDSLRTVGEYTFRGTLRKGDTCTAHPRYDAKKDQLVVFGEKKTFTGGKVGTVVTVRELSKDMTVQAER